MLAFPFLFLLTLSFEGGFPSEPGFWVSNRLPGQGRLRRSSQAPPHPTPLQWEICSPHSFLPQCWGPTLRASCLLSKHLNHWAIFPAPDPNGSYLGVFVLKGEGLPASDEHFLKNWRTYVHTNQKMAQKLKVATVPEIKWRQTCCSTSLSVKPWVSAKAAAQFLSELREPSEFWGLLEGSLQGLMPMTSPFSNSLSPGC